jgi:hypothetical protein|tara:strand:+ start:453 stop:998 length:546 start_codon:yes stop_codon:yes gene_type:complete
VATYYTRINKRLTASDGDSTDQGDITGSPEGMSCGISSKTHGYRVGGGSNNEIDRFAFASSTGSTDVGDLPNSKWQGAGCSSTTHGYAGGGANPAPHSYVSDIQKFAYAASSNSASVGSLTQARRGNGTQPSSTTHGYCCGGYVQYTNVNTIDRWPFASDAGATNVGDMTGNITGAAGCQY